MKDENAYIMLAGVYDNRESATADLKELEKLQAAGVIRQLNGAVITKDENGRLKLHQRTAEGQDGAAAGLVIGAVPAIALAAVFPPAGLAFLGFAAVMGTSAAGILGAVGHFRGGLSRQSLNDISALLETGESALIAVAVDAAQADLDATLTKASKKITRDLDKGDVDRAATELAHALDKADTLATVAV